MRTTATRDVSPSTSECPSAAPTVAWPSSGRVASHDVVASPTTACGAACSRSEPPFHRLPPAICGQCCRTGVSWWRVRCRTGCRSSIPPARQSQARRLHSSRSAWTKPTKRAGEQRRDDQPRSRYSTRLASVGRRRCCQSRSQRRGRAPCLPSLTNRSASGQTEQSGSSGRCARTRLEPSTSSTMLGSMSLSSNYRKVDVSLGSVVRPFTSFDPTRTTCSHLRVGAGRRFGDEHFLKDRRKVTRWAPHHLTARCCWQRMGNALRAHGCLRCSRTGR